MSVIIGANEGTGTAIAVLCVVLVALIIMGMIGNAIGEKKGIYGTGFWYGFFLGPIGLVIIALADPAPEVAAKRQAEVAQASGRVPCPHCAEQILPAANVCPHCRRDVN